MAPRRKAAGYCPDVQSLSVKPPAYVRSALLVLLLSGCGDDSEGSSNADTGPSLTASDDPTAPPALGAAGAPVAGGMPTNPTTAADATISSPANVPSAAEPSASQPPVLPDPGVVDPFNPGAAGADGAVDMPGASGSGTGGSSDDPMSGNAGMASNGGAAGASEPGGTGGSDDGTGGTPDEMEPLDPAVEQFSFFVVSMAALQELSGSPDGFGGDLSFGQPTGIEGADEICRQAAEMGIPGAGSKTWRAFLSVTSGPDGNPINARDRIGTGPWHDALGRLVAEDLDGLFSGERPAGDPTIVEDLPNERGEPNHYVGPGGLDTETYDNHDTITGSDTEGMLVSTDSADTCEDWTSTSASGRPMCGHSWPRSATSGREWASDHNVPGCAPGIDRTLGGSGEGSCIGCSGGYGGFYCFALSSADE